MKNVNLGTRETPNWFTVTTISINGKEEVIIPAFTEFSIKQKDFGKDKIYHDIDKGKILPTVFCFANAEVFTKENVKLFDYMGRELNELPEHAPTVRVYLDKADNINLWNTETPLTAELVNCTSVADAYQRVATTAYLSQNPSKDDWIGFSAAASNNELLLHIKQFSNNYGMNGTAAQGYFGLNTTSSLLQSKAISKSSVLPKGSYRTHEQAKLLMETTVQAFGAKAAKQTRYIKAINYCISEYGFETVCKALDKIGATEKLQMDASKCEDKVKCLQGIIIEQVILIKNCPR